MKKTKAFTILELVVVMAIIAIIMGLGFLGLITLRSTIQLQSGYSELIGNLKVLQNRSINSVATGTNGTGGPILPTVYAIRITSSSYQFYGCSGTSTLTCTAEPTSLVSLTNKGIYFSTIGCDFIGFSRLTGDILKIDATNGTYTSGTSPSTLCKLSLNPTNNQATKSINIDIYTNKIEIPNN